MFSPESKFMQILSRISDLIVLNLIYIITCLPVFTIGAATTALYTVCFRFDTDREQPVFRSFFRAFRQNFKQGTILWLLILLWGASAGANVWMFFSRGSILSIAFAVLTAVVGMLASFAFPLLSQFENSVWGTLKNALVLSLGYLPRAAAVTVLNAFPLGVFWFSEYAFVKAAILWSGLYFSAAAYFSTNLLRKVFAPFRTQSK